MLTQLGGFYSNVNRHINNTFAYTIGNKMVYGIVYLLVLLYVHQLSPDLPESMVTVFKNTYFRIFMYVIILWTVRIDVGLGLLLAIAFVMTVNLANGKSPFEFIENTTTDSTSAVMQLSSDKLLTDMASTTATTTATNITTAPITTVITPTLKGDTVVNPEIVVTPLVVTTPSGEKVLVTPVVNVVSSISPQVQVPVSPTGCYFNSSSTDTSNLQSAPKNISYSKFKSSV